jgi:hypothetical protein
LNEVLYLKNKNKKKFFEWFKIEVNLMQN